MVLIVLYVIYETSSFFPIGPKVPADVGPSQGARQVLETTGSATRLKPKIQLRSHRLCQFSEEGNFWFGNSFSFFYNFCILQLN